MAVSDRAFWTMLEALRRLNGNADRWQLEAESGYSYATMWHALTKAINYGLAERPSHGHWSLTERGKIALAIHNGKQMHKQARQEYVDLNRLMGQMQKLEVEHAKLGRRIGELSVKLAKYTGNGASERSTTADSTDLRRHSNGSAMDRQPMAVCDS